MPPIRLADYLLLEALPGARDLDTPLQLDEERVTQLFLRAVGTDLRAKILQTEVELPTFSIEIDAALNIDKANPVLLADELIQVFPPPPPLPTYTLTQVRAPGFACEGPFHLDTSTGDRDLSDAELASLVERYPNIESLTLFHCYQITTVEVLCRLENLRSLNLFGSTNITNSEVLGTLENLESLVLCGGDNITDAVLERLSQLPNLKFLGVRYCEQVSDAGLANLVEIQRLQSLDLTDNPQISRAGFAHLVRIPNLRSLVLIGCDGVTNAVLEDLSRLENLQFLDLSYCQQFGNIGLGYLSRLHLTLQSLDLRNCSRQITREELENLRQRLPNCNIIN